MALDTPARIAIIGAGPMGLEAALYARFLGYDVDLYEQTDVAAAIRAVADQRMPTAWIHWTSPLGLAALQAQGNVEKLPAPDAVITFGDWWNCYLNPLAQSDLLLGRIHTGSRVVGVRGATVAEWEAAQATDDSNNESPSETSDVEDTDSDEYEEIIPLVLEIAEADSHRLGWADLVISATGKSDIPAFPDPPLPHLHRLTGLAEAASPAPPVSIDPALRQIRDLFAVIADRKTLDLYRSMSGSVAPSAN